MMMQELVMMRTTITIVVGPMVTLMVPLVMISSHLVSSHHITHHTSHISISHLTSHTG